MNKRLENQEQLLWNPNFSGPEGQGLISLINSTVADGGTLGFAQPLSPPQAQAFLMQLQEKIQAGNSHALYLAIQGQPAMFVMMNLNTMPNCTHTAELAKGVVAPSFRGQGLVKLAFNALVERARQLGIEQFVLDVREGSRAHALWQRFGFTTWGVLPDYARVDGKVYAGHYMAQSVESLAALVNPTPTTPGELSC